MDMCHRDFVYIFNIYLIATVFPSLLTLNSAVPLAFELLGGTSSLPDSVAVNFFCCPPCAKAGAVVGVAAKALEPIIAIAKVITATNTANSVYIFLDISVFHYHRKM